MSESRARVARRIAIIGGGITGLAAAYRLIEHNRTLSSPHKILLLDSSSRAGGVIRTVERDGFLLEEGPDSFISEKPEALALAERLDLAPHLIETNPEHRRSFIVREGRLRPVPEGFYLLAPGRMWPFVTTDIFSWTGKARMALDLLLPRGGNKERDESLAQFVRRRLGREALERMAQPMVGGIYTADPEKLSLRTTMPRFLEMERTHRSLIRAMWKQQRQRAMNGTSGARYSLFLSFDQGMQTLTDALVARLPKNALKLNAEVTSLDFDKESREWKIKLQTNELIKADAIIIALPAYRAGDLLRNIDASLSHELEEIPYASTATINLAYRREMIPHPLDGFGFVVPFIEKPSLIACTFSSVKFAGRAPEGYALLRAFVGGALQPEMFALDEEEMTAHVQRDLKDLLGIESAPLFTHVVKWSRSMAQYHVGHLNRVERIDKLLQAHPTLKLAGNAYSGAGIPDCIRSGETTADEVFTNL